MQSNGWLLLLYALPTGQNSLRVSVWRKLRKTGAVSLKTSASLLPDTPTNYELFQWFTKQIQDGGGEATLVRAKEIESMTESQIVALFNAARAEDYDEIIRELTNLVRKKRKTRGASLEGDVERLRGRFSDIQKIDFFHSARAHDAQMLLKQAESSQPRKATKLPVLKRAAFQGRTWLTRPRPHIDRVGSAWLIKTFIDSKAKFVFAVKPEAFPDAVPYDMVDVELTHQGEDCTFETLLKRFALGDRTLERIAEMIHDADLEDQKFRAPGAEGIDRVLKGLAQLGWADDRILQHGVTCFDALYAQLKAAS